jgi:hypothetical protein
MSTLEPNTPIGELHSVLRGYLLGDTPLVSAVAAIRALPPGTSGDFASSLGGKLGPEMLDRLEALMTALSDPDRAV